MDDADVCAGDALVTSRRRERHVIAAKLPGWWRTAWSRQARRLVGHAPRPQDGGHRRAALRGRPAASSVKRFILQVVELAYVRDRIDRGFGDARVFALQNEEAHRVLVDRAAAAPALQQLQFVRFPVQ